MLEPWDEVINLQKERQLCADDVQTIRVTCVKEHGKKHPIECPDCWYRLVNRIRDRYLNCASKEWFSGRRPFLVELDTMFNGAHNLEVDLKTIEQRIVDEKKEWYRDKAKNIGLSLQNLVQTPSQASILQARINDRSFSPEKLASELRLALTEGISENELEQAFKYFVERLKLAKSPQERNEVYINMFFQRDLNNPDDSTNTRYQKYIDMVKSGAPVTEAFSVMIRDRHAAERDQKEKKVLYKQHEEKLEELKRAKAAHELDKAKRDKARQDKVRAAAAALADDQNDLPPCSVCSKVPDAQDFITCPVCRILGETYGLQIEIPIFCSHECEGKSWVSNTHTHISCGFFGCILIVNRNLTLMPYTSARLAKGVFVFTEKRRRSTLAVSCPTAASV